MHSASGRRKLVQFLFACGLATIVSFVAAPRLAKGQTGTGFSVAGRVLDPQGQPVPGVLVEVRDEGDSLLAEAESQEDGSFVVDLEGPTHQLVVVVSHPHYVEDTFEIRTTDLEELAAGEALRLPDINLEHRISVGFWIATFTFVVVLLLIGFDVLHNTTASLLGVSIILVSSLIVSSFWPEFFVYDFERALTYLDFDVIFLLMGMMVVVGTIESTGVFQWLAYMAYRLSRGRVWLLVIILVLITGVASALLDNVTTMLLVAPITLEIALALGINPLSLLVPEILASNVSGISTLVGTPTNILIGSFASIGFNDFVVHLTPGVLLALLVLIVFVQLWYHKDYRAAASSLSPRLAQKLAENAQIKDPRTLFRSLIVFVGILVLFVVGERFHVGASVAALLGATVMLIWVNPDIERMLRTVDWTTLVFFITLFMLVGAVREVGLMSILAEAIGKLIGERLVAGLVILVVVLALLSSVVPNIPLTASMLPVVGFLTSTIPGAENKVLFYGLSVGAAMGGNGTLIGGETNVITAGISERAGYPITFAYFLKVGFPSMVLTAVVGTVWLLLHF